LKAAIGKSLPQPLEKRLPRQVADARNFDLCSDREGHDPHGAGVVCGIER
jgi:hypothetical protein